MFGKRVFAKGRVTRRVPGQMSGLEKRYLKFLDAEKAAGRVHEFRFEGIRLKLADLTYYTPDFYVLYPDGGIEMLEVKGSWKAPNQDKSRVKVKVAAEQYPEFKFVAITEIPKKKGGGWDREEFAVTEEEKAAQPARKRLRRKLTDPDAAQGEFFF